MEAEIVDKIRRPGSVIASASLAMLGSFFTLIVAAGFAFMPNPHPAAGPAERGIVMGVAVCLAALAGIGLWTSIALYQLRPWSRISILIFAGVMVIISALTISVITMVPLPAPAGTDARTMRTAVRFMLAGYSIPLFLGSWWLIEFNRPRTKAAFAARGALQPAERPLAISILSVLFITGAFTALPATAGFPAFIAGMILEGIPAQITYLLLGAISLYVGWGLWKLDERARKFAIAYVSVTAVHGLLVYTVPSMQTKMLSVQRKMPFGQDSPTPDDMPGLWFFSAFVGVLFAALVTWILVRNRTAFDKNASSASSPQAPDPVP